MNINQLAKLAGVSVSTVSKIMNNKDTNISAPTRERVLKLAKEYHYQPYSVAISKDCKTWTLGVLLRSSGSIDLTLTGILEVAQEAGYTIMIRESKEDLDAEHRNISAFCTHHIDGLLWEPIDENSLVHTNLLQKNNIPVVIFNSAFHNAINIDYSSMAYQATQTLVNLGHTDIACLITYGSRTPMFLSGYKHCLFDKHVPLREDFIFSEITENLMHKISTHSISAVVVSHYSLAAELFEKISMLHYNIPYDISIIALKGDTKHHIHHPVISYYEIPHYEFGKLLCNQLINKAEKICNATNSLLPDMSLNSTDSIGIPHDCHTPKIAVFGSINIDNYLTVDKLPHTGKAVNSSISGIYVGGKAINQAIGTAKLGHRVSIWGCVGNDVDSDLVYTTLNQYNIDPVGIKRCSGYKTGQAHIFVQHDGESMISIMPGANEAFTTKDLSDNTRAFDHTAYCLIQTEIPLPAVIQIASLAKQHGSITILKPTTCGVLPHTLLQNIDFIVPNQEELDELCPSYSTLEEKVDFLLTQGVETVIVTMAERGCYVKNSEVTCYLPAAPFNPVDTSGACDAFISALASYLLYGCSLIQSIKIASYAAGFSITREGVVPSLIDKHSLEAYIRQHDPDLLK